MARAKRQKKGRARRDDRGRAQQAVKEWEPKTRLGRTVKQGQIATMSDVLSSGLPLKEVEIVDTLLPELSDEVIDVNMVQRMTDSGRKPSFRILTAVGNGQGFLGLGQAKGKEVGETIKKAVSNAKLQMIEVERGCGSWECGCDRPHSVPFKVCGKSGSVEVTLIPAPRGVSLIIGDAAKPLLKLAGIEDVWSRTDGRTRTTGNYAKAVFEALKQTGTMRR